MYTLEDLKEANLIVRNEYDKILKELEQKLYDTQERLKNLESAILYNSDTSKQPTDSPKKFQPLTTKQILALKSIQRKTKSDWAVSFVQSILDQGSTSEKQRVKIKEIYKKL